MNIGYEESVSMLDEDSCSHNYNNSELYYYGTICVTMVSSLCSLFGSSLIILTFVIWPDLRTTARAILVFLAIADFLSAVGYLFASALFLGSYVHYSTIPPEVCTFQSFLTTAFPISSFLWTANLAVYLFVSITLQRVQTARKLMIFFHLIAWGIPLLLCIPGAATGKLGNNNISAKRPEQGSVAWCWVNFDNSFRNDTRISDAQGRLTELHVLELVFGKLWEFIVIFLAIVLCIAVKVSLYKMKKQLMAQTDSENSSHGSINSMRLKAALNQLDQRLIWIPIVFILVRCWGTIRWIIASSPECMIIDRNCSVAHGKIWYTNSCFNVMNNPGLEFMQAIGDPAQGWANALLFVVFHGTIARRLCPCFFVCCNKLRKKFERYGHKRAYSPMGESEDEVKVALTDSSRTASVESFEGIDGKRDFAYYPAPPDQHSVNSVKS